MHNSGKAFAWLVLVGCVAATYFSAKALGVRNGWMAAAQKAKETFEKNKADIAAKELALELKQKEYDRLMLGWDRYWPDVGTNIDLNTGTIRMGIGTNQGLKNGQVVYSYMMNSDGSSVYLGDFRVTRIADAQADAVPVWRNRPGDLQAAKAAPGKYRIRTLIPNQYQTRFAELDQQILAAEQSIAGHQSALDLQTKLFADAERNLQERLAEIKGNPALEGKDIPDVFIQGLLASLSAEDEARNNALREVDELLHNLKQTKKDFEETLKKNRQLTDSLLQTVPPAVGAR
jgi:hypothetical protein